MNNTNLLFDNQTPCKSSSVFREPKLYRQILHRGKKAFKCSAFRCGKIIRFKCDMERHIIAHTDCRPFICTFPKCDKTFKREDALSNHLQSHSEELNFACPMPNCKRKFRKKAILQYHLTKHHRTQRFPCDNLGCDKILNSMKGLKRHKTESCNFKKIQTKTLKNKVAIESTNDEFEFPALEFDSVPLHFDEESPGLRKLLHCEDGGKLFENIENEASSNYQVAPSISLNHFACSKTNLDESLQSVIKFLQTENRKLGEKMAKIVEKIDQEDYSSFERYFSK